MKLASQYLAVAAACLVLAGCGDDSSLEKHPVSGTVTFQGQPVQEGNVNFRNEQYGGGGVIDATGAFTVEGGLPAGTYLVYVTPPDIQIPPTFGKDGTPSPQAKEYPNIPQKYRLPATSELSIDIKSGDNTVPIAME
jgi:hypothetical protein